MESNALQENIELCKLMIQRFKPYPVSVLEGLLLDDKRYDPNRIGATYALDTLIKAGVDIGAYIKLEDKS